MSSSALAHTEASSEPRLLEGIDNIIRALRLPRNTSRKRVAGWVKKLDMPAFRVLGRGAYYADPEELAAWWKRVQTSALTRAGP